MPQDNTLGAPTEGLGQTVTFAANGRQGVPQTTGGQRSTFRTSASGGAAVRTSQALQVQAPKGDTLFQTLARLGGEVLKPQLEAERMLKYAEGMQQAAQGQAITEIVDEQPWYSKLFGSTSLVDGARAYTASSTASAIAAKQEADMENLRKLSANEMAAHSANLMRDAANTGDATTDAMITQSMTQTLPGLMKAQAKAHLGYQQEQLTQKIGDSFDAGASHLRAVDTNVRKPNTTADGNDLITAGARLTAAWTRPPEISKEVFDKVIITRAVSQVSRGNFALYDAMEGASYLAKTHPEYQTAMRTARHQATLTARGNMPMEFLEKQAVFASLSLDPMNTPEKIKELRAELQHEYTTATGDNTPVISNATTVQELRQLYATQEAERDRLRKAAEAALKPDIKKALEIQGYQMDVARMIDFTKPFSLAAKDKKEQQGAFDYLAATVPPATRLAVLANQGLSEVFDDNFKSQMRFNGNAALANNDPLAMERVYQEFYLPMVKASGDIGQATAQKYAGDALGDRLARWHAIAQGTPATADTIAQRYSHAILAPLPKGKQDPEVVKSLQTYTWWKPFKAVGRAFGVSDSYPLKNADQVEEWIRGSMPSGIEDVDQRTRVALDRSKKAVTVLGGYGWLKSANATGLEEYFRRPRAATDNFPLDEINQAVRLQLDKVTEDLRLDGDIQVGQAADDPGGIPRLFVAGTDSKGAPRILSFSAADIKANYLNKIHPPTPNWNDTQQRQEFNQRMYKKFSPTK